MSSTQLCTVISTILLTYSLTQLASHPVSPSTTLLCINLLVSVISTLQWAAGQPLGFVRICWLGHDCEYVINTTVITPCITINHFTVPQSTGVCYFYLAMSSRAALKICWLGRDCQYVINTTVITPSITINHFTVPQSAGVRYYFHLGMSSRAVLKICWLGRDCQYVINTTMHCNKHNITYLSTQLASHPLSPATTLLCLNLLVSIIFTLQWAAGQPLRFVG